MRRPAPTPALLRASLLAGLAMGCGQRGEAVLLAADLDFGDVPVGVEARAEIVLRNAGSEPATVDGIEGASNLTGPDHRFRVENLRVELEPGDTARIPASFVALDGSPEPILATVRVGGQTVRLRGRGVLGGLQVSPSPLDFGPVLAGGSRTLSLTLTNVLPFDVHLRSAVDASGKPKIETVAGGGRFEILSSVGSDGSVVPDGALLARGASIELRVAYTAGLRGADRARWRVLHCESRTCETVVELAGRPSATALSCAPSPLVLRADAGERVRGSIRCTNLLSDAARITGWSLAPGTTPELSVEPALAPATVDPGDALDVAIEFEPTAATVGRDIEGALLVRAADPRTAAPATEVQVPIIAQAGRARLTALPVACDFGEVALGAVTTCAVALTNRGARAFALTAAEAPPPFEVELASVAAIAPGATATVTARFRPRAGGPARATLTVRGENEPPLELPLSGVGFDGPPCAYRIEPTSLDLGSVLPNAVSRRTVTIENVGTAACRISAIVVAPGPFELESPPRSPLELAAGQRLHWTIAYRPVAAQNDASVLRLRISSPTAPEPEIALSGGGDRPYVVTAPRRVDFGIAPMSCAPRRRSIAVYALEPQVTLTGARLLPGSAPALSLVSPPALPRAFGPGQPVELTVEHDGAAAGLAFGAVELSFDGRSAIVVPLSAETRIDPAIDHLHREPAARKTDVLFVVGDMFLQPDVPDRLIAGFSGGFLPAAASAQADWQLGVLSEGLTRVCPAIQPDRPASIDDGDCGYLRDRGEPGLRLITPDEPIGAAVAFDRLVREPPQRFSRAGLDAVVRALSWLISTRWNAGLRRRDADLAVVLVTEGDDMGAHDPEAVAALMSSLDDRARVTAWALSSDAQCGGFTPPARYGRWLAALGGEVMSACDPDYAASLERIAAGMFMPAPRLTLPAVPDPSTLSLSVDGQPLPLGASGFTYDSEGRQIRFAPGATPEPGAEIRVRYRAACE